MHKLSSELDLFLTEISIELLGNKVYDLNGRRQEKLVNLFKAVGKTDRESDFLCSLGLDSNNFTKDEASVKEFLNDQLSYTLKDANTSPIVNDQIITTLRDYKTDQKKLAADARDLSITKTVEKVETTRLLDALREKTINELQTNTEKEELMSRYYEDEKDDLLKKTVDTIRLLKYILNDISDEQIKGDLIGYIHAMRIIKDKKHKKPTSKPYQKPASKRNQNGKEEK